MRHFNIIIYLIIFLCYCCISSKRTSKDYDNSIKNISEIEYYKIFTEATKNALIYNNYKRAIDLYNICIAKYPENAAPYYQLSSIYINGQDIKTAKRFAVRAKEIDTNNIWYKINLANIYQIENQYDSAILLYENIVKISHDPEYIYNLTMLYSQAGKEEQALKVLKDLEKEYEGSKEVIVMKHNIYNNMRLYDSAIYELEILTKYFPDDIENFGMLAEYLSEVGRNNYAKRIYNNLLEIDSLNGLVLLSFGDYYLKNNNIDSSFYYYGKAFYSNELNIDNKIGAIINFIRNKDFVKSNSNRIEGLLKIISNESYDFRIFAAYADLYISQKDYKKAKMFLDSALVFEKKNYMLWEQAIMIDNYLNNYLEVIKKANECLSYFSDKVNIYLFKAYSEKALGNFEAAIKDVEKLLSLDPEMSIKIQTFNLLAELYREIGLYDLSNKYYEEILTIDPENLMVRNNYGYYLSLRNENLSRAKELSYFTIEKEPKNPTYLDTYGWILYKMGNLKEAKEYIEEAIRFGAFVNAEVLDHYGEIMLKLGKCHDAIEAWERAIEVDTLYNIKPKLIKVKKDCR